MAESYNGRLVYKEIRDTNDLGRFMKSSRSIKAESQKKLKSRFKKPCQQKRTIKLKAIFKRIKKDKEE